MKLYLEDLLEKTIKYDGKKYAWNQVYFKVYQEYFEGNSMMLKYRNGRYHLTSRFCYKEKKSEIMDFSGDIVFNFFDDAPNKPGKRRIYTEMLKIIEKEKVLAKKKKDIVSSQKLKDIEEMLVLCNGKNEKKANIAIMPSTGGMQIVKQAVGRDRFDTFVWCLSEHYQNKKSILYNHCAAAHIEKLQSYLNLFETVYDYCSCVYNLDLEDDKILIDKLIDSGSKPIDCSQRVLEYVLLANEFWHRRIESFQEIGMINPQGG